MIYLLRTKAVPHASVRCSDWGVFFRGGRRPQISYSRAKLQNSAQNASTCIDLYRTIFRYEV